MDTYIIEIRLNAKVDPAAANEELTMVVSSLQAHTEYSVDSVYAVQHPHYDYLVVLEAVSAAAAQVAAAALSMQGDAKTSVAPTVSLSGYTANLEAARGIRGV
jgi:hypothetical protein